MIYCSLCGEEVCLTSKFCVECAKIKKYMAIYGREKVYEYNKEIFIRKEPHIRFHLNGFKADEKALEDKDDKKVEEKTEEKKKASK